MVDDDILFWLMLMGSWFKNNYRDQFSEGYEKQPRPASWFHGKHNFWETITKPKAIQLAFTKKSSEAEQKSLPWVGGKRDAFGPLSAVGAWRKN